MNKNMGSRLGRLMICGLLAFATVTTACSSDSKDETASSSTTSSSGSSTSNDEGNGSSGDTWCDAARAASNAIPSERLELTEAASDVVPDELRDDYEALVEFIRYQVENPSDAVGIAERTEAITQSYQRLAAALKADCGITADLG